MEPSNLLIQISQAVQIIKTAILQSQEHSAKNVNTDVLVLNYAIGGYISNQVKLIDMKSCAVSTSEIADNSFVFNTGNTNWVADGDPIPDSSKRVADGDPFMYVFHTS